MRDLTMKELSGLVAQLKEADFGNHTLARGTAVREYRKSCVPCMKKQLHSILSYSGGAYADSKLQQLAASSRRSA